MTHRQTHACRDADSYISSNPNTEAHADTDTVRNKDITHT